MEQNLKRINFLENKIKQKNKNFLMSFKKISKNFQWSSNLTLRNKNRKIIIKSKRISLGIIAKH